MRVGRVCCALVVLWYTCSPSADSQELKPPATPRAATQQASTAYPLDTVVASNGDAYVVDRSLPGVWLAQGDKLQIYLQGSKRFRGALNAVRCIAIEKSGSLLVGDSATREIYRIDSARDPQPLTGGIIGLPMDIAVRADGSFMVADLETRALLRVSADGKQIHSVAKVNPRGVFVDGQDRVWVVSQDAQQLQIVDDSGQSQVIVEKPIFEFPHQVVVDAKGHAFVSDGYRKAIWKIVPGSTPEVVVAGPPLDNPVGLALRDDRVIITDPRARRVFQLQRGKCETWFEIPAE